MSTLSQRYGKAAAWLEKFGWKEGKGLGTKENGMVDYVKVTVKKDYNGLGASKEPKWDNWWEKMYDQTLQKVSTLSSSDNDSSSSSDSDSDDSDSSTGYSSEDESEEDQKRTTRKKGEVDLFALCGGARFSQGGVASMSGKLRRLEQQDQQFKTGKVETASATLVEKSKKNKKAVESSSSSEEIEKPIKKKGKKSNTEKEIEIDITTETPNNHYPDIVNSNEDKTKKRKTKETEVPKQHTKKKKKS